MAQTIMCFNLAKDILAREGAGCWSRYELEALIDKHLITELLRTKVLVEAGFVEPMEGRTTEDRLATILRCATKVEIDGYNLSAHDRDLIVRALTREEVKQ